MNKNLIIGASVAGALAFGTVAWAGPAPVPAGDHEKCAGVVKAGKNDCATKANSCAGSSTKDRDAMSWIYVPKGTCERISGGHVVTGK